MQREILELDFSAEGEVVVHVKGFKGPDCLEVRELFKEFLGPVRATAFTDEYFEDDRAPVYHEDVLSAVR